MGLLGGRKLYNRDRIGYTLFVIESTPHPPTFGPGGWQTNRILIPIQSDSDKKPELISPSLTCGGC